MAPQPQQHLFVSRRSMTIRSTLGASITFEKGQPTHVPKQLHELVMEKGILPCDAKGTEVDLEAVQRVSESQKDVKVLVAPEDAEERLDAIKNACRQIAERNASADFNAGGNPTAAAVSLATGWRVDQKEVRQAWVAIRPEILGPKQD